MMPFDTIFPDIAKNEARVIRALDHDELPRGTYVFRELYCNEPNCDCRRALVQVYWAEGKRVAATVNYAFEPPKAPFADEPQIFLDPMNPQSDSSSVLFDMFKEMIAADRAYHDRLVRHYEMWKRVVDDPTHPDHARVRSAEHDDPSFRAAFPRQEPVQREGPKIGPNEPCPCGSGKKYKRCCRP
ncbi:MAG TPA: SEC-C metal-binding domain-containing protein [Labilithrix sp.]|nr:SEC-C metal-binding domain-containing protein [Labilithrix sp.]